MNTPVFRIGHGYDVHRLVSDRRLILGGVDIPHETGLLGHSDADVLTHAVMDALLGALALLIGAASLNTFALQAIICIVAGGFCNLVGSRIFNTMLLAIAKDQYKYFRLVREDDDDE